MNSHRHPDLRKAVGALRTGGFRLREIIAEEKADLAALPPAARRGPAGDDIRAGLVDLTVAEAATADAIAALAELGREAAATGADGGGVGGTAPAGDGSAGECLVHTYFTSPPPLPDSAKGE